MWFLHFGGMKIIKNTATWVWKTQKCEFQKQNRHIRCNFAFIFKHLFFLCSTSKCCAVVVAPPMDPKKYPHSQCWLFIKNIHQNLKDETTKPIQILKSPPPPLRKGPNYGTTMGNLQENWKCAVGKWDGVSNKSTSPSGTYPRIFKIHWGY